MSDYPTENHRIRSVLLVAMLCAAIGMTIYKAATAPITYDEAYTYLKFSRKHTSEILSDYEFPNNHILHTIAVRITTRMLGDSLLAIRLPGLIGGITFVAGLVALGRRLDEPMRTGWPLAAAFLPIVMEYNGLARGYAPGAAACIWSIYLLIAALEEAKRAEQRTRGFNLRLIAIGLLLGIAIGFVPTFGIFVVGILSTAKLLRQVGFRPLRVRRAILGAFLIALGMTPVLVIVYWHVSMEPREWPWGHSDWRSCNQAFWEHTLDWPGAIDSKIAVAISASIIFAMLIAAVSAVKRKCMTSQFLLSTLSFSFVALILAKSILETVWPLPRTIHWLAPLCILALLLGANAVFRSKRAAQFALSILVMALVVWSICRWNSRQYAGWEDNAAIPDAIAAIERDFQGESSQDITIATHWQFDVCVEYAAKRRSDYGLHWMIVNNEDADYHILRGSETTPRDAIIIFDDEKLGVRVARRSSQPKPTAPR